MFYSSFILNLIFSFIFLLINSILSIQLTNFFKKNKLCSVNEFNIFVILISIYLIVISFLNLFYLSFVIKYFVYLILLLKLILVLKLKNFFYDEKLINFFKSNGIYNFFIIIFFLISILPLSDADSIASHLYVSKILNNYSSIQFNEDLNIESLSYFGNEILLQISFILKSDNFGSQLNFFSLLIFLLTFQNNENFKKIIFSIPLIIFFISIQKLQLFYGLIFLSIFITIHKKLLANKIDLFITIYLIIFYCSGKLNYLVFGFIIFIYMFIKNFKQIKNIFIFSFSNFLIILLPIFLFKIIQLSNPIAPFYDNLFLDRESFRALEISLRSSEGWYTSINIIDIFKPFLPLNLYVLSSGFGLIFIFLITDLKTQKDLNFIPIILIISILLSGQLLPRYYFEAFLILAFFVNFRKVIQYLAYFQSFFIFSLSLIFVIFAYSEIISDRFLKEKYQKKYSYSYYNSQNLNKYEYKILGFNLDRASIFFNDNIYSMRLINSLNLMHKNKNKIIIDFLEKNKINHIIHDKKDNFILKCTSSLKIDEIYFKVAIRNFLKNESPQKKILSKIKSFNNECRY